MTFNNFNAVTSRNHFQNKFQSNEIIKFEHFFVKKYYILVIIILYLKFKINKLRPMDKQYSY